MSYKILATIAIGESVVFHEKTTGAINYANKLKPKKFKTRLYSKDGQPLATIKGTRSGPLDESHYDSVGTRWRKFTRLA